MCACVLTSFSLLRKRETLARRIGVGHGRRSPLRFFFLLLSSLSALTGSRELSIDANDRSQRKKKRGGALSLYLSIFPLFFFRARAITLVCEGPLAIGMKVGSCVEMESPGPRLYTHLPTRTRGQDRARGPRPSSPFELRREGPLFQLSLFVTLLGLSAHLISPSLFSAASSLFLFLLTYTVSRISASSFSPSSPASA